MQPKVHVESTNAMATVETDVIMRSVQEEIATYEEATKVVFDISFAIKL